MKKYTAALLLAVSVVPVFAQTIPAPAAVPATGASLTVPGVNGSLDLTSLIKSLHPVYVYDQHKDSLGGADLHVISFHSASGTDWVNLNAGLVWRTTDGIGGPMVSARVRWDNVWGNATGTSWAQKYVSAIKVPQVEAGPFGGYINRLGWLYGVTAAMAF